LFDLIWHSDGSISFKANNGKLIGTKKSGHLYANSDSVEENTKYYFYLINRPVLVLKCEQVSQLIHGVLNHELIYPLNLQGFVGYKASGSNRLECNKASYETIIVERAEKGVVHLKGNQRNFFDASSFKYSF